MTDRDTIKHALYDAIDWQLGLADAYSGNDTDPAYKSALRQASSYRAVLKRRYGGSGKTPMEELTDDAVSVPIDQILSRA